MDGFESTQCSRHANNDPGKAPPYPAVGEVMPFTEFGTRAVRMTERGMFGDASLRHRHSYSRRQAWNADETLLDLNGGIINAENHSVVVHNPNVSSERNWSNVDPDLIYAIRFSPKPNELVAMNVRSGEHEVLHRFNDYAKCSFGEGEGNLSNDDRYVLVSCSQANDQFTLFSVDLRERMIMGQLKARKDFNWASFTQSGRFVVVKNNQKNSGMEKELVRYTPDLKQAKLLTNDTSHGDLGIDLNGEDVFVMIDWNRISYIVISSGERIKLGIANQSNPVGHGHVSCRGIRRPGWCFLSSYDGAFGAFRLGGDGERSEKAEHSTSGEADSAADGEGFEQWGYTYSTNNSYDAQPKASVSPSGKQAIFSTDWGGSQEVNDFVVKPDVTE